MTFRWDPVVIGPPAVALIAVLAMLMTMANPIHHPVPAPAPGEPPHGLGAVTASPAHATARPGATSRPSSPSIRERTTLAPQAAGSTARTEIRSPLLVVPAPGPLGLKSVQAP